jgi:hypothetical protein
MERLPTLRPDADLLASIPLPEKDQPVLAAAIRGGCDTLITVHEVMLHEVMQHFLTQRDDVLKY